MTAEKQLPINIHPPIISNILDTILIILSEYKVKFFNRHFVLLLHIQTLALLAILSGKIGQVWINLFLNQMCSYMVDQERINIFCSLDNSKNLAKLKTVFCKLKEKISNVKIWSLKFKASFTGLNNLCMLLIKWLKG